MENPSAKRFAAPRISTIDGLRAAPIESTAMERVSVDDVEPDRAGGADRHGLTDPLGATDVAINLYRLAPGERASGLHAHTDQEEVFFVVEGEATFETLDGPVVVGAGEVIRFAPGEYHSGTIAEDSAVAVYALGAPPGGGDVRVPLPCPECGHDARRPGLDEDGTPVLICPECAAETGAECPGCGSADVQATLADDGETPVGVCQDCGALAAGRANGG